MSVDFEGLIPEVKDSFTGQWLFNKFHLCAVRDKPMEIPSTRSRVEKEAQHDPCFSVKLLTSAVTVEPTRDSIEALI